MNLLRSEAETRVPEPTAGRRVFSERIAVRFGATFIANLLRGAFALASGILIARGLGAAGYGDINFLLGTFIAIGQLLDMGTASAFYTFISRRPRCRDFFFLYLAWMLVQFGATLLVVGLILPANVIDRIWLGHDRDSILLAFVASFLMTQGWGLISQLGEAIRKTVLVQTISVIQAMTHLALVFAAVYWAWLTVQVVLWLLVAEYAVLAVTVGPKVLRSNVAGEPKGGQDIRAAASEFIVYCKPLVVYGWVGFLYAFADRWLLQEFGGAEQQGFLAVGQQFANVSLIATASLLKIYWKEIAEARDRQDAQRVYELYTLATRGLYFTAAWVSCMLIPYTREILGWTLGTGYENAWVCLALMFLYPVHQTLGQLQGTFFYASGDTGTYARIGILMMAASIPVTYFLLAPASASVSGLELGAVGIAIKLVVLQIIGINVQRSVIARRNGWVSDHGYQALVFALLLVSALLSKGLVVAIIIGIGSDTGPVAVMVLGVALYSMASLVTLYRSPALAGLTDGHIRSVVTVVQRRLPLTSTS